MRCLKTPGYAPGRHLLSFYAKKKEGKEKSAPLIRPKNRVSSLHHGFGDRQKLGYRLKQFADLFPSTTAAFGSSRWEKNKIMKKHFHFLSFLPSLLFCALLLFPGVPGAAPNTPESSGDSDNNIFKLPMEWGGQLKLQASVSDVDSDTIFGAVESGKYYDANVNGRLKNRIYFSDKTDLETHYELVFLTGDTWRQGQQLAQAFPAILDTVGLQTSSIDDGRRLFDLTSTISENDNYILYHRLDRLVLTLQPNWGVVRLGRQAVTWGNGLLFNPMDLFNPFAPTDIERDYKVGDDLLSVQIPMGETGNLQFLVVPRRNPDTGDVEGDHSSLAGKLHFATGTLETDLMAAIHYEDIVLGVGNVGYLGDAAWRVDITWTFQDEGGRDNYLSLVANIDYSWLWAGKNFYGFFEYFFSGLGDDDYAENLLDADFSERFDRGELFTLGRNYLSGTIQVELHPLVNFYVTLINNLEDPSGILQPRLTWSALDDLQITLGGSFYYGGSESEFGGFTIPGTDFQQKAPARAFLWATYYF